MIALGCRIVISLIWPVFLGSNFVDPLERSAWKTKSLDLKSHQFPKFLPFAQDLNHTYLQQGDSPIPSLHQNHLCTPVFRGSAARVSDTWLAFGIPSWLSLIFSIVWQEIAKY